MMRLTLMQFNVQDLFLHLAYQVTPADLAPLNEAEWQLLAARDVQLKPLAKLRELARILTEVAPDVVCVNEVGGPASLVAFCDLFLAGAYEPFIVAGNDRRGIDTGFLVRADLGVDVALKSHKNRPVPFEYDFETDPEGNFVTAQLAEAVELEAPKDRKLSRDVPELWLTRKGESTPFLALLGVHLKSPLDLDGIDRRGIARRTAELKAAIAIRRELQASLGDSVPIILMGDFNSNATTVDTSPEATALYAETDLRDALDVVGREPHERITHITYFGGVVRSSQLDYIFLPPALQACVDEATTRVYRYNFAEGGGEMQLPLSFADRRVLPSDHYPVICVLEIGT